MKHVKTLVFAGLLLAAFASAAGAVAVACPLPPFAPSWWLVPGDPQDGVTRTQFHSFITNPNPPDTYPDYTYNGWNGVGNDAWDFNWDDSNPPFGMTIPGGVGPDFGDDGLGIQVPGNGTIEKTMQNLEIPNYDKFFFGAVSWWDPSPLNGLEIQVLPEMGHNVTYFAENTITNPDGWRLTYFWGTIVPQPDFEVFVFHFDAAMVVNPYVDSIWVGTHCVPVPEPSTMAMVVMGGLGILGGVVRKIRR